MGGMSKGQDKLAMRAVLILRIPFYFIGKDILTCVLSKPLLFFVLFCNVL